MSYETRLTELIGRKCPDFEEHCVTCLLWRLYDLNVLTAEQLVEVIEDSLSIDFSN